LAALFTGRVDEFIARFPSALLGTIGILAVYYFARRLWNRRTALFAAIALSTSFGWWRAATISQVDMTLAVCISCALMLFHVAYRQESARTAKALGVALLLALATLAKGPLGVAVPGFVIVVFLVTRRDVAFVRKLPLVRGAFIFLLVAGSWYAAAYWQQGWSFFRRQIVDETLLTGVGNYGHHQPIYYFFPVLFYDMLPWSFFFPGLAVFLYRQRRHLAEQELLFPLIWLVAVFTFFSVFLGKRGIYILPLYPAAALLFAVWWNALCDGAAGGIKMARWLGLLYGVSALVALGGLTLYLATKSFVGHAPGFFPRGFGNLDPVLDALAQSPITVISVIALAACASAVIGFFFRRKWRAAFACLALIAAIQAMIMRHEYAPYIASTRGFKSFMARVIEKVDSKTPLLFYRGFDYGAIFYARRHVPAYGDHFTELRRPYYLLMWEEDYRRLAQNNRLKLLDMSEGRGPAAKHRLVLIEPEQDLPISDPQGYGRFSAQDD
jgi:Dolichyl-phosphate-mannose-protein mannosyltransferase